MAGIPTRETMDNFHGESDPVYESGPGGGSRNKRTFFQTDPSGRVVDGESSNAALLLLAFYSFLMFTCPLGVFFLAKQILVDFEMDSVVVSVAPAIAAVVTVNLIIVFYVYSAFKQSAREKKEE